MKKIYSLVGKSWTEFSIIAVLSFLGMFGKLGVSELQPLGSAAHAAISREILRRNDWLTLHWPYCPEFEDFYQFPPLFFWCQAICYKIFGISDTTSKYTSAFFGFLTIIGTFYLGKMMVNSYTGFLSAMTLILFPYFFRHSRKCEVETILIFFILLGYIFFILAEKYDRKFILLSGISTGLAFLSKGPPAAVVPLSIVIYYLITKQYKKLTDGYLWLSMLLSIIIPLFWIIPQIIYKGDAFYKKFVINQVLWKITGGDRPAVTLKQKILNYTYFFRVFFSYYLPWSITGLFGIYKIIKSRIQQFYILFLWVLIVWTGFTIAGYKDDYYLLAFFPGWAVINGFIFYHWTQKVKNQVVVSSGILSIIMLFVVLFTPIKFDKVRNPEFKELARYIKTIVPQEERVIIYNMYYWDMIALFAWYCDRGVTHPVTTIEELEKKFFCPQTKFLFIKKEDLEKFPSKIRNKMYPLVSCGRFCLLTNNKIESAKIVL